MSAAPDKPFASSSVKPAQAFVFVLLAVLLFAFLADKLSAVWLGRGWIEGQAMLDMRKLRGGQWWTPLTYALVHLDPWHLLWNGLGIALFGRELADTLSPARLLALTLCAALGGAALWVGLHFHQSGAVVGASAILTGYVAAFVCAAPRAPIRLPVGPLAFPRYALLVALVGLDLYGLFQRELAHGLVRASVSHSTHLGGCAAGLLFCAATHWLNQTHRGVARAK